MRWESGRRSDNIEDRRGMGLGGKGLVGGGIGTVVIARVALFMGVDPGETKEWTTLSAVGAPCDQVRLRVRSVACSRRCGEARWMQQGLAGLDVAPQ